MPSLTSASRIVNVVAFVDWNAQILLAYRNGANDPHGVADVAFRQTARRIARCLDTLGPDQRFRVTLRLYHGWHKGYEPTTNLKAARLAVAKADFAALSQRPNVVFSPDVEFGDRLSEALTCRLHQKLGIHLPNTLRRRFGQEQEEKMVDTALAADVVALAYREHDAWLVIVTEDDDLIPPLYVAEAVRFASSAKVVLLRKRAQTSMMSLDGLLVSA